MNRKTAQSMATTNVHMACLTSQTLQSWPVQHVLQGQKRSCVPLVIIRYSTWALSCTNKNKSGNGKERESIPMFGSHRLDLDSASTLLRPLCGIEYIYLNLRLHIGEQHHTTAYRDAKSCQPSSFARKFSTSNELLKKPPQSILFVKKKHDTTVAAAMNDVTA